MKMCLSIRNIVLNALSTALSFNVNQGDCMLFVIFQFSILFCMRVTINDILLFTSPHCVLMTDRVLLNNSLTKLDDICREMPRLNWLWVMYHVYISKAGLYWNLKAFFMNLSCVFIHVCSLWSRDLEGNLIETIGNVSFHSCSMLTVL